MLRTYHARMGWEVIFLENQFGCVVSQVAGFFAGVDEQGKLIELGWSKWPTLMHLAWQGQWQHYLHHLNANLSIPALTVPIFVDQVSSFCSR